MATAVVFGGGPTDPGAVRAALRASIGDSTPSLVVAADSGLVGCHAAGLRADLVVGDMDSVPPAELVRAEREGARVERHPVDKDAVDLELALDLVARSGPEGARERRMVVIGSPAGRLDHLAAAMALLGSARYAELEIDAYFGSQRIVPVHSHRVLEAPVGTTVSLLALHGPGARVTTRGLRWPLEDHEIAPGSSIGVSNTFAALRAEVSVTGAPVTVFLPSASPGVADPAPLHGPNTESERPEVAHDE